MKRLPVIIVSSALFAMLAACGSTPSESDQTDSPDQPVVDSRPAPAAPDKPEPVADGPCPYLTSEFIGQANGQRATKVRISADKPYPSCFFYRADGAVQLTVQVFTGDPAQAKALVDQAAPVDTSNPANSPSGWTGGSQTTDTGAVYAVAKAGNAVVVTTNQQQTIKARRVVEKAIAALEL
jgi:UPF0176 protein